jgi:hypothetical protein
MAIISAYPNLLAEMVRKKNLTAILNSSSPTNSEGSPALSEMASGSLRSRGVMLVEQTDFSKAVEAFEEW